MGFITSLFRKVFEVDRFVSSKTLGSWGEKEVSSILSSLPKDEYKIFNDVMLPAKNRTTQIDHIIVSSYGIFIIETKNYKGWIFGSEKSKYWMQTFYKTRNRFLNPMIQNNAHVVALRKILGKYRDTKIITIVAFSDECVLKNDYYSNVIYFSNLKERILNYKESVLIPEEINDIMAIIYKNIVTDKNRKEEHVSNIYKSIRESENDVKNRICPKCGGKLVERQSKYGKFFGCSNYPECRFIKNINK